MDVGDFVAQQLHSLFMALCSSDVYSNATLITILFIVNIRAYIMYMFTAKRFCSNGHLRLLLEKLYDTSRR